MMSADRPNLLYTKRVLRIASCENVSPSRQNENFKYCNSFFLFSFFFLSVDNTRRTVLVCVRYY